MARSAAPSISIPGTSGYPIAITGTIPATDSTLPVVTAFALPPTSDSLTIDITSFTASDDAAVTGYKITESATPPSVGDAGWTGSAPATITASTSGAVTFYPWAKDADDNVSLVYETPQTVNIALASASSSPSSSPSASSSPSSSTSHSPSSSPSHSVSSSPSHSVSSSPSASGSASPSGSVSVSPSHIGLYLRTITGVPVTLKTVAGIPITLENL